MKLYIKKDNFEEKSKIILYGTDGTGIFNLCARRKTKCEDRPKNNVSVGEIKPSHPSQIINKRFFRWDQQPPEDLINEIFARAVDIHTRQAVYTPEPETSEPMCWDSVREMYIFLPRPNP